MVGIIACVTYVLTREASGSFWDCGEFVSSAYKIQLPHPPGAPTFVLLGRFFIILFGNSPLQAAQAVNLMSALASGLTILFLFWTITHFARKMFVSVGEELTSQQIFTVMSAGVVGALIYCFSDSFWYSAVEGEVYGLSSFFTALVFWAMLKWEHADEKAGNDEAAKNRADRWIIFIFFMMGVSIGVHLLNLLTIPAIVMIYYFRRFKYSLRGAIFAFVIGCLLTWLVLIIFIQYSIKAAGIFDIFAVNNFHLGFFTGFSFYFILVALLIAIGLRFKNNKVTKLQLSLWLGATLVIFFFAFIYKGDSTVGSIFKFILVGACGFIAYLFKPKNLKAVKLALWCYAFISLGYSTYFTTLIRSNANPSIDMYKVDNPMSLVGLLSREQYGEPPLVYGPHFMADINREDPFIVGEMKYVKGKNKYIAIGKDKEYRYSSDGMQVFPRVWDRSNEQGHADFYASWLNLYQHDAKGNVVGYEAPTYSDNMKWFFTYQMGLMYWRYFMWNFAGKQNDLEGLGNVRDGNWITGIPFIDNQMLGDQSKIPDSSLNNKSHNKLYLLPFLLGILGCVYQFIGNRKDWIVNFLLFFMTGIAIGIYLNMPGNQPRERDYASVGSFYAFAIWAGLAIPAFIKLIQEKENKILFNNTLLFGAVLTFVIGIMSDCYGSMKGAFMASLMMAILYLVFTAGLTYLIRALSSGGKNLKIINIVVSIVGIIAPIIMAQQEWDDHDRSKKYLPADMAKNYLRSCAPNAILITFGDNDTYPLWYAQEVEGVRPDIRIINNSLLGIDWYINQLRHKVNQADSIDVIWTPEQIEGHNREYIQYQADSRVDPNRYYPLYDVMKNVLGKENIDPETGRDVGPETFPVRRFSVPVDTALVRKNGTVNPTDSVYSEIKFEIPMQRGNRLALTRSDWIILNMIAANGWKRPIYFTSPYGSLGFLDYLRRDGLTFRLVPAKTHNMSENWLIRTFEMNVDNNLDHTRDTLLNTFVYKSKKGAYFDEENRRHALSIRNTYAIAAGAFADAGRKEDALKLLQKCESMINPDDLPYAMISKENAHNIYGLTYLEAAYKAGDTVLVKKLRQALKTDLEQQKKYYDYLKAEREELFSAFDGVPDGDAFRNEQFLKLMDDLEKKYNPNAVQQKTNPQTEINNANKVADSLKGKDSIKK